MEAKNEKIFSEKGVFVFPNLKDESGEIKRVAQIYALENQQDFIRKFLDASIKSEVADLTEQIWSKLENTDSFNIKSGDFDMVSEQIIFSNSENGYSRDWQDIKQKMEQGQEIDAPVVLHYNNTFHLVSGNTRLMVSRAMGIIPKVLIVEI